MRHPFHELANLFPLIEGGEFAALVADIKENGLRDPIDLFENAILDGRNRARACEASGITPSYQSFFGTAEQALSYVISKNLKRRHLDESQRAYVAAKIANLGEGRPLETRPIGLVSQQEAAGKLNVSTRSIRRAVIVRDKATPEIQRAVEQGKLAISMAAQAAVLSPEQQRKIAEEAEAGHANAARTVIKQETRSLRESDLGAKQYALPTKKYGVILADPEWRFEPWSRTTGMDRAADNHYPTSCTEVIAARDVPSIAADDCVLFLWATAPMLPHALLVMAAWGFDYKSHLIWYKQRIGTGYWFRNMHELLLLGTKGNVPAPAMGQQSNSFLAMDAAEHSAKPEYVLQIIEGYFPTLPKIELNRRGPARPGWDAWGNEAEEAA